MGCRPGAYAAEVDCRAGVPASSKPATACLVVYAGVYALGFFCRPGQKPEEPGKRGRALRYYSNSACSGRLAVEFATGPGAYNVNPQTCLG